MVVGCVGPPHRRARHRRRPPNQAEGPRGRSHHSLPGLRRCLWERVATSIRSRSRRSSGRHRRPVHHVPHLSRTHAVGNGGPLRVAVVVPVGSGSVATMAAALADHRAVPTTLAVSPRAVEQVSPRHPDRRPRAGPAGRARRRGGARAALRPRQRGGTHRSGHRRRDPGPGRPRNSLLRTAGLHPNSVRGRTWPRTSPRVTRRISPAACRWPARRNSVLDDTDLAQGGRSNYTSPSRSNSTGSCFGRLGGGGGRRARDAFHGRARRSRARSAAVAGRALLGPLRDAFLTDRRGVVVSPPSEWQASGPLVGALLGGSRTTWRSTPSPWSSCSTRSRSEATTSRRPGGCSPARRGTGFRDRRATDRRARVQLSSYSAVVDGRPTSLTALSDDLLATESRSLSPRRRTAALDASGTTSPASSARSRWPPSAR